MELGARLNHVRSTGSMDPLVQWVGCSKERFTELFELIFSGIGVQRHRAAWVMSHVVDAYPYLAAPFYTRMIEAVLDPGLHQGIHRSFIRLFIKAEVPPNLHGQLTNMAFTVLSNPKRSVAEQAFSIKVLVRMVKEYPGLANELTACIEDLETRNLTPGLRSAIRHARKDLRRINGE